MNIIRIEETASTNALLKELAQKQTLEEMTVLITQSQTAGRGQRNNHWESESGKNLTFSILLHPVFLPLQKHFLLSEIVALAVLDTLRNLRNLKTLKSLNSLFSIKWANDIYFENKKIAGILIENEIEGRQISLSILGIGLNVNQAIFTSDAPNPVSLLQILHQETDLEELLANILQRFEYWYEQLKAGQYAHISDSYHKALYRKAGFHSYKDQAGIFNAQIQSVADDGILQLITDTGETRHYAFKEVAFVL
jgi:BirA family biotin operon repressor/biotin-[acetyl-CoA-carboxylase] ligase